MKGFIVVCMVIFCIWQFAFNSFASDATTKYPIVLIHGFLGFGDGMSWLARYFGDIPKMLKNHGNTVYIADVHQANTITARGEKLRQQLKAWGHRRYNLIGHSHGGLDARYVLEVYPDLVASVTTIGTPHRGSKVADYLFDKISRHRMARLVFLHIGDMLGHTIGLLSGTYHSQNIHHALAGLTTQGLKHFNQTHKIGLSEHYCSEGPHESDGRKLYSWGSIANPSDHDAVARMFRLMGRAFSDDEENDGVVAVCSMKFGKWLGAFSGHHLTPVSGVIFHYALGHAFMAEEMFRAHAIRLHQDGL